ncbi:IreB family regulatory phosphoprotein [Brevibacillus dissolubilis]|uniref:IreB family regulatory phosphoprotein n=1 Tax=Brevibacillus dissolubilis TaxID=1844116 RepID=UPI00111643EE|nr:IreB family regulatory phosphoprotein [Brevibacillus dissolubilis]
MSMDNTVKFTVPKETSEAEVKETLSVVYTSLQEKGYNPITQIVGYLLSGDPAFIPRHNNARSLIGKIERDKIIEEMVKGYLATNRS